MSILEDQLNLLGNYLSYDDFVYWLKLQLQGSEFFLTSDLTEILNEHKYKLAEQHKKLPCCVYDVTREELIPYFKKAEKEGIFRVIKYHKRNKELPIIITKA